MDIKKELKNAYRLAKELAGTYGGKVSSRIVTVYDGETPWAEVRVEFNDGEPKMIKIVAGETVGTKPWEDEKNGLESIEKVLSTLPYAELNWLGE